MLGVERRAGKVQVHDAWRALIRHPAQEVEVDFSHRCATGISEKQTACLTSFPYASILDVKVS